MPETRESVTLTAAGALTVGAGKDRWAPAFPCQVVGAVAAVGTAPTGAALIFDLKKNGTTIYTTTANRPTVAAGNSTTGSGVPALPDVVDLALGDVLTLDVIQIGSTVAGSDARVVVEFVAK